MENYSFFMPTKVIHGEKALFDKTEEIAALGQRCLIITGRSSARLSGALDDVVKILNAGKITYKHFDGVENNPSLTNVGRGGEMAREFQPDFIIAIGGGSPLDAAKAVAVLATNDIEPKQLYTNKFDHLPLSIIAVPTTAGTGSEVTPYSILTDPKLETKKSFTVPELFPKIAILDWRYTESLPINITRDTAVDALSHLVEGYLSKRATGMSDVFAKSGIELWGACKKALTTGTLTSTERDNLLVSSALGGMTISHTGTTLVHALGYSLTYYHDMPHGRANGVLMAEYLRFTEKDAPGRVKAVLDLLNLPNIDAFQVLMDDLVGKTPHLSQGEVSAYAERAMQTRNVEYSRGDVTKAVLENILKESQG
ncbi:MAG: iron-containing alcohol dehydrogenase [Firmicutes bacterium]|nr:iron-containing alcohol dehydrogenase [Bacillota bacterium]